MAGLYPGAQRQTRKLGPSKDRFAPAPFLHQKGGASRDCTIARHGDVEPYLHIVQGLTSMTCILRSNQGRLALHAYEVIMVTWYEPVLLPYSESL